jgi:hypothetical protein
MEAKQPRERERERELISGLLALLLAGELRFHKH